jgi:SnoaL-like domain
VVGMEERLRLLEDREAIRELTARYAWFVARAEIDEIADLYTEDGRFGIHGREEMKVFLRREIIAGDRIPLVQNHIIEVNGDSARGTCSMFSPWSPQGPLCGFYQDRFRRDEGSWRFRERKWSYHEQP